MEIFHNDWKELLSEEMKEPYYQDLRKLLIEEYRNTEIFPKAEDIFNALHHCSYKDTKVVILGQDPYHGYHQAHGLSFSVPAPTKAPPSLKNIFKELKEDLGIERTDDDADLTDWADQGVLLLNTTLTVRAHQPMSHGKIGWEFFTDRILSLLDKKEDPVVFILWGAHARSKKKWIKNPNHYIIESPHPSPLSAYRGFFGSKPFSKCNEFLEEKGLAPIRWGR
ncbi:uracil-DNA glycosylase [Peptoniphilus sp. KCTC 25270]|uniref:uracil-DNA glycosylase n=1 Tax=Peptoniphilus sp. KCTC 25270 TaxID=2897414 RepID=UPI001E524A2B|nr:uracil-DNA glycosylase [Peptoniphilus sp. KCTC 25270]MCD1147974.1 uracil-DNA glycosylase [Peptoniphilus sp. KCTC 25270]